MSTNQTLLLILIVILAVGGGYLFLTMRDAIPEIPTIPALPTADRSTQIPNPTTIPLSATQQAEAVATIPPTEYIYIYNNDLAGLQSFLNSQVDDWTNKTMNIHSISSAGVGNASVTVENDACSMVWPLNKLCRTATIEFVSVYKGVITAGVNQDFVLHPQVSVKTDSSGQVVWYEIKKETKGNVIETTLAPIIVLTYSGDMCVTSVEENTPSAINTSGPVHLPDGSQPPLDVSYTMKTKDETLYPNFGSWKYDNDVNEEYYRNTAYKIAKINALLPEKIHDLLSLVEKDLAEGYLKDDLLTFWNADRAKLFGVAGFEIVVTPNTISDDFLKVRCDGTLIHR